VGVIAQPDWRAREDFMVLGEPRLFFGVSSGVVDSMVNHYTPAKKPRSHDSYSEGGVRKRPDRATIVYADLIHASYPNTPIVLGGVEASLRRFAHYDYWDDRVRQSVLADAPADLLVYGMGETQVVEVARRLEAGAGSRGLEGIRGTCHTVPVREWRASPLLGVVELPTYSEVATKKETYAKAFALHSREQNPFHGKTVVQPHPKTVVVGNPPAFPLTQREMDRVYALPFSRRSHPSYLKPIPALDPVRFSITSHRGCFGACAFCAITHHQGRVIQSRSAASIMSEVARLTRMPDFFGTIQDIGGPTANMFGTTCSQWQKKTTCPDRACSPSCPGLDLHAGHHRHLAMVREASALPGVKKVVISSGLRYDLIPVDDSGYLEEICTHHISGHLKVAPEHIAAPVLSLMGKAGPQAFLDLLVRVEAIKKKRGLHLYPLPYFMAGHPGCTIADMVTLAEFIRDHQIYTEQVQDFTPTPMSSSTCMYHTGLDPATMAPVHVPKGDEKRFQRALLHYRDPKNFPLVREGLRRAGREDLIGTSWNCLVPPSMTDRRTDRYARVAPP
jgi:uncharacterized radical SAM protein YgiQ